MGNMLSKSLFNLTHVNWFQMTESFILWEHKQVNLVDNTTIKYYVFILCYLFETEISISLQIVQSSVPMIVSKRLFGNSDEIHVETRNHIVGKNSMYTDTISYSTLYTNTRKIKSDNRSPIDA